MCCNSRYDVKFNRLDTFRPSQTFQNMQQDSEKEPKRKADGKVARLVDFGHVKINKG